MVSRKAILIANPGEYGAENYCEGVNKDMENYTAFLKSPLGGFWYDYEIEKFNKPSSNVVRDAIQSIKSVTYSMIIFCGHGWYSERQRSTILELNKSDHIDSADLRNGSKKHTLILDCCRKIEPFEFSEGLKAAMRKVFTLNPTDCRKYYDLRIEECEATLVVMHACSINETAGDNSENGGYYSFSLIERAKDWAGTTSTKPSIFSVVSAHDSASPNVKRLSGNRQNPQIEKPRSAKYFPFAIVA